MGHPRGLLAFSHVSPLYAIATPVDAEHATDRLVYEYFGLRRLEEPDALINFNLPYGGCGSVSSGSVDWRSRT